jgi:hypothetical protein
MGVTGSKRGETEVSNTGSRVSVGVDGRRLGDISVTDGSSSDACEADSAIALGFLTIWDAEPLGINPRLSWLTLRDRSR